jgi:hypothetical protein
VLKLKGSYCGHIWHPFEARLSWRKRLQTCEGISILNSWRKHVFWMLGEFVLKI